MIRLIWVILVQLLNLCFALIRGIWNGTCGLVNLLTGNTVEGRNQRRKGIKEYQPSEIGGFFQEDADLDNMIISGGTKEKRVEAMEAYINLSCYCDSAVLILHANDYELEKTIEQKYGGTGRLVIINGKNPCFDPFYGLSSKEIGQLIKESADKDDDMRANVLTYLDGLTEYLYAKKVRPSYELFQICPYMALYQKTDDLVARQVITSDQGDRIKSKLMAGQSEYYKLEAYFSMLDSQMGDIAYKRGYGAYPVNLSDEMKNKKIVLINVGMDSNRLLIDLILARIKQLNRQRITLACVIDEISVSDNLKLENWLKGASDICKRVVSATDVYAMCSADERLFNALLGNSRNNVIFKHTSVSSAKKWSEAMGYYEKEEVSTNVSHGKNYSPYSLFPGSSTSSGSSISMKQEYIVKPEEILQMDNNEVYIYKGATSELIHTRLVKPVN